MSESLSSSTRSGVSVQKTFASLHHHNYRLWFTGQLVSLIGTWMQSTAQGYLVYQLTNSSAFLGYVGFAAGLPTIIFTLYGGLIADRLPRRNLLIITQSFMMVLAFILAGLVLLNWIQPWMIIVLAFLLGIANAFDAPARQAFVTELVPREDLTNAIALNSIMFNGGAVVGPAVAGFTYAAFGPVWCFAINGISFLAVIAALFFMKLPPLPTLPKQASAMKDIFVGVKFAMSNDTIRMLLVSLAVYNIFAFSLVTLIPALAVSVLHGDVTTNGLLVSARGIGGLLGGLMIAALAHLRMRGKVWTIGYFVTPITMAFIALTHWLPMALVLFGVLGWALMSVVNNTNALVQGMIPDELRGRVMGVYMLVLMGSSPLGSLFIGTAADLLTEPTAVLICASVVMAFALFTYFTRPQLRRLQ